MKFRMLIIELDTYSQRDLITILDHFIETGEVHPLATEGHAVYTGMTEDECYRRAFFGGFSACDIVSRIYEVV